MKKKHLLTKCAVLAAMATIAMGIFTGCGSKSASNGAVMDKEHVFHADYYDLPKGITSINSMKVANNRIYLDGYNDKNYVYQIYSMDLDGGDEKVIYDQASNENANVASFAVDSEGNVYFFKSEYGSDESDSENVEYFNKNFISKLDADGKELYNVELKGKEDFYPSSMIVDEKGKLFLLSYESMEIFDKDGKHITSIDTSNSYIDSVFLAQDGKVMITQYNDDYTSKEIKSYDEAQKKFTEAVKMEDNISNFSFYQATAGYDLFMKDTTDLYGYKISGGEKTKIINWIDSDIDGNSVNNISGLSDGRLVCVTNNYMKNTSELAVLSKVDPKDVVDKTVLTLSTVYDMQLSPVIIEFNKKSDKYRIQLKDYSVYNTPDDYEAGSNKLNTDIISGNVPDILCLNDASTFESYTSKGLFLDYYELMEKDDSFKKSDYLENIFKTLEKDGKLYSITPSFSVFTMIGKTSDVGNEMGWTMDDLDALIASKPEGTKVLQDVSKNSILYYGNFLCMDQYVNWKKGTCSFDNEEFIRLLEFANQFKNDKELYENYDEENYDEGNYEEMENDYRKGKILLMESYISSFKEFHRIQKESFGEDATFIGFPTANKNGSAFSAQIELAISSKSSSKDAAWEFVKTFFTDDYQENCSGWPVKLSAIEKRKQADQTVETYKDENGKEVPYEDTYTVNGKEEKLGLVTDEECEKVMAFLKSLNQVMRYDTKVYEIMQEETGAFFAGQKTAEETAKLIQNRVQTYLNEIQ